MVSVVLLHPDEKLKLETINTSNNNLVNNFMEFPSTSTVLNY
jgi:hypothetical protein